MSTVHTVHDIRAQWTGKSTQDIFIKARQSRHDNPDLGWLDPYEPIEGADDVFDSLTPVSMDSTALGHGQAVLERDFVVISNQGNASTTNGASETQNDSISIKHEERKVTES